MPTPSEKSEGIDNFIKNTFGIDRKTNIKNDRCTLCGGLAIEFEDEQSKREFEISGMCQSCQDKFFE